MTMTIKTISRVLFAIGVVSVGWLSLVPQDVALTFGLWDKLQHFAAYAVLAICGFLAFAKGRTQLVVAYSLAGYGCVLEIAQIHVADRSGSIEDAIANAIGVLFGLMTVRLARRILDARRARN